jgi:hypothetical protein
VIVVAPAVGKGLRFEGLMTSVGWLSSSVFDHLTGPGDYHHCAADQVRTETS